MKKIRENAGELVEYSRDVFRDALEQLELVYFDITIQEITGEKRLLSV